MIWFSIQGVMMHTSKTMKEPSNILKYLFKVSSMLNIWIWYDNNDVPDSLVIKRINCNNVVGYELDNKILKYFITVFVTNEVFQHIGLYWIIDSKGRLKFDFEKHCTNWIINGPWHKTTVFTFAWFII